MNKLARYIFFVLLLLCVGNAFGQIQTYRVMPGRRPFYYQPANPNPERRVEGIKINFIRERLNLPPEQAQKFFPVYREYLQELSNIRKLKRQNNLNAADGQEQVNKELMYESEIVQVKMKFNNAFLRILTPDKVSELYKAEREFNDELVRQLSERNQQQQQGPPPPGY